MHASAAEALRAQAAALRTHADALEALAETATVAPDELLDARTTLERYGIGHGALKNAADRGELELVRGARRKLLVRESELRRWLTERKYQPRVKSAPQTIEEWTP